MMYDHIQFHADSSAEPALTHMAYYYTWAVAQGLHSEAAAQLPEFSQWQQGRISASQFIMHALRGGIDETCFNALGQRFTAFYYADEDEGYGAFMSDYFATLGLNDEAQFYAKNQWLPEEQSALNAVFQAAFQQWKASLKHE